MDYFLEGLKSAFFLLISFNHETYSAIYVSVYSTTLSMIFCLLFGLPVGFLVGFFEFHAKNVLKTFFNTMMAMPTVVIGLFVYFLISRRGPLGEFGLLFTIKGMAIGQFFLGIPIVIALTISAIEATDTQLKDTLKTLGASGLQIALTYFYESRFVILAVIVTAYSRIIAEIGIAMMLGGNIKGVTRTITTTIALETVKSEFALRIALGMVLNCIAFVTNSLLMYVNRSIHK